MKWNRFVHFDKLHLEKLISVVTIEKKLLISKYMYGSKAETTKMFKKKLSINA